MRAEAAVDERLALISRVVVVIAEAVEQLDGSGAAVDGRVSLCKTAAFATCFKKTKQKVSMSDSFE